MGRGKVVLERIENKVNRQVTFGKRKNGMIKKAQELSVLCDAEVAMIIFSGQGKLFEFGSVGTRRTVERYRQLCSNAHGIEADEKRSQSVYQVVTKLRAKYQSLHLSQRHLLGEDLEPLSLKKLQSLEKQVEGTLSKARKWKTTKMLEQMEALRKMENDLEDENKELKSKVIFSKLRLTEKSFPLRKKCVIKCNQHCQALVLGCILFVPSLMVFKTGIIKVVKANYMGCGYGDQRS